MLASPGIPHPDSRPLMSAESARNLFTFSAFSIQADERGGMQAVHLGSTFSTLGLNLRHGTGSNLQRIDSSVQKMGKLFI
jgi:hypothetical protein